MSEAPDKESKTEEATPKKVQDALGKGNVPHSREVTAAAALLGIGVAMAVAAAPAGRDLTGLLRDLIANPDEWSLVHGGDAKALLVPVMLQASLAILPVFLLVMAFGIVGTVLQNPPRLVPHRMKPEWSRLSLKQGASRIFGKQALVELAKSLFKLASASVCALILFASVSDQILYAMQMDARGLPRLLLDAIVFLTLMMFLFTLILAAADLVYSQLKWKADLRMTRQELKDEMKQAEGDPLLKARQRSLARERARRRMIAAVPRATVVIANPTHYAVALRYVRDENPAPIVLAKGQDLLALKIREIAEKQGIPVVEDKVLARSLHQAVVVDQIIPPEFYKAVAEVILFVMKRDAARR